MDLGLDGIQAIDGISQLVRDGSDIGLQAGDVDGSNSCLDGIQAIDGISQLVRDGSDIGLQAGDVDGIDGVLDGSQTVGSVIQLALNACEPVVNKGVEGAAATQCGLNPSDGLEISPLDTSLSLLVTPTSLAFRVL